MTKRRTDATRVVAGLERLYDGLRRLVPAEGISLTAASTLRRLDNAGPHRISDLAVAEGVTQPAMTQLVTRLERDALAERAGHPGDGRVVLVQITETGRAALRERREVRAERLAVLLDELTPADRTAILAAMEPLGRLVDLLPPKDTTA